MANKKIKVIVVLGPTASGKTRLGVKLADILNGEIIGADSRQVYRGMDIGTGKDLQDYTLIKSDGKKKNIPYHLIDVADPMDDFSLSDWKRLAETAIVDISSRQANPIVVGGTGLYLQALVNNYQLVDAKPDLSLRTELEKLSASELFSRLEKINYKFANGLHESDQHNQRRLVRYLEIFSAPQAVKKLEAAASPYNFLILGVNWPIEELRERIKRRLIKRLDEENMVEEVASLQRKGVTWKRLESFGLEYKFISWYLQEKIEYEDMLEKLILASGQFAKRQNTWWRRWEKQGVKINWVTDDAEAEDLVRNFLKAQ